MRVLVVLAHPPLAEGTAAGRHGLALLAGLRAHGLEVVAIAADLFGATGGDVAGPPDLAVDVVPVHPRPDWPTRLRRYATPLSVLGRGTFAERVADLSADADVVHVEEAMAVAAVRAVRRPCVVHLHSLARRDSAPGPPWRRTARVRFEFSRGEARIARRSRWLVANSAEVAGDLRARARGEVQVAALALDPAGYAPRPGPGPAVAGLIGTGNWPPTADAVRRLLCDVWPLVRARRPDAVLRIAGRGMGRERLVAARVPDEGVEWVGEVPSAAAFLRTLGLLLYPLGRGSGTKVKVLEAMAMGLPVVTTPSGAEGLARGRGVVVEADPRRIAAAAVALLDDAAERAERGAAARAQFVANHTPEAATAPLPALYERMVKRDR